MHIIEALAPSQTAASIILMFDQLTVMAETLYVTKVLEIIKLS